jgi:GT2 family glycosyltransferase
MDAAARSAPFVCAVVINWNNLDGTLACLRALKHTTYQNLGIVVVDNGSRAEDRAALADLPDIELALNAENLGFTGGVNTGIDRAMARGADYVWLLNNDATAASDVLDKLVAAAEADPGIGLVSPVFHDPDAPDRAEFCLGLFDPLSRTIHQTTDPEQAMVWQRDHQAQVVLLGTALLLRRALIERIGGLDTTFFAYVEDVDYSLRSTSAGFRNVAVPDAIVLHKFKEPVARPGSVPAYLHYFMSRNYLLLWRKMPGPRLLRRSTLWFLRQRLTQIERMPGAMAAIDALLAGLWDGVRGVGGRYDPTRRAPAVLRRWVGRHPGFWLNVIDGRWPFAARP